MSSNRRPLPHKSGQHFSGHRGHHIILSACNGQHETILAGSETIASVFVGEDLVTCVCVWVCVCVGVCVCVSNCP